MSSTLNPASAAAAGVVARLPAPYRPRSRRTGGSQDFSNAI